MTYYACNMNLELQTRAVEYTSLFTKHNIIRYFFNSKVIVNMDCVLFLRSSIVERMPVLINTQTTNTNNGESQEPIYDQENQTNHVSSTEPVVDLLKMLDEPVQTNGDILGTIHQQNPSPLNPLEDLLFGNSVQHNYSHNGKYLLKLIYYNLISISHSTNDCN
jgi:hypothetical protein